MNFNEIKQLIETVDSSDLQETIIEEGDFKIILRRTCATTTVLSQPSLQPAAEPAVKTAPQALNTPSVPKKEELKSGLLESRSPIVGTFYQSSSPDAPPFVAVNDTIKKGDVLCIIEAMKLMNEIEAEVSGTIVEILVENGQAVEYSAPVSLAVVTTVGFVIQFWKLESVSIKVLEGHIKILQGINSYLWVFRPQEVSDLSIGAKLGDLGSEVQFWKASQNFEAAHNFFNGFGQQFLRIFLGAHRAAQNLDPLTQ